jgi:protein-tyrosine phosphatase
MDFCSQFDTNAYFGPYPSQEQIAVLELQTEIDIVINLACGTEDVLPYMTTRELWKYPIRDKGIPTDWKAFSSLIYKLDHELNTNQKKVYVHCRGGHGRSTLLVACYLAFRYSLLAEEAIRIAFKFHNDRVLLRECWRTAELLTKSQKIFIYKLCSPICFTKSYMIGNQAGFNTLTAHAVTIDGLDFPNAECAYQALRNIQDTEFVELLLHVKNTNYPKLVGEEYAGTDPVWEDNKEANMMRVLEAKYEQHPQLVEVLISTGIRPIFDCTRFAHAHNLVGETLMGIRRKLYL